MFSTEPSEGLNQEESLELAGSFGTAVPEPLMAAAEEVRRWFVLARGGAPFLSAADGRLLVNWLEAGISVAAILRAIESVSTRRLARRSKAPFHLDDCEATLKKILKGKIEKQNVGEPNPEPEHEEIALVTAALARLAALPKGALTQACEIAREFHEELWEFVKPRREELVDQAASELADLAELLGESGLRRAAEERARTQLRGRYPQLSITRICEEFDLGVE